MGYDPERRQRQRAKLVSYLYRVRLRLQDCKHHQQLGPRRLRPGRRLGRRSQRAPCSRPHQVRAEQPSDGLRILGDHRGAGLPVRDGLRHHRAGQPWLRQQHDHRGLLRRRGEGGQQRARVCRPRLRRGAHGEHAGDLQPVPHVSHPPAPGKPGAGEVRAGFWGGIFRQWRADDRHPVDGPAAQEGADGRHPGKLEQGADAGRHEAAAVWLQVQPHQHLAGRGAIHRDAQVSGGGNLPHF